MKNNFLLKLFGFMLLFGVSAFAATDPIQAFGATFTSIYSQHLAKVIVLGVVLFGLYEFQKTKQFTFLVVAIVIAVGVVAAPDLASSGATTWKTVYDAADVNGTTW